MSGENWKKVTEILGDALKLAPENRAAFLDEACAGNESVRHQVETLLADSENIGGFMEQAAIGEVAEMFVSAENNLKIGERFNHYEIIKQIGAGGMGRARPRGAWPKRAPRKTRSSRGSRNGMA